MHSRLGTALLLFGLLLPLSGGCGGKGPTTYTVTGTVTFNDAPLADGRIALMPVNDRAVPTGGVIVDGKFTLKSAPGEKIVEITATREAGPVDPQMGQAPREQYIPSEYNVESKLRASVEPAGPNEFHFALRGAAGTAAGGKRQ